MLRSSTRSSGLAAGWRPWLRFTVVAAWGLVLVVPGADAQSTISRKDIDVQRARNRMVEARGAQPQYSERWDLRDLPEYKPEQRVSGTIRMWGLNYLADCQLARYWEDGFRKYHPDIQFDYHLKSALAAIPALVTGVGDIGASRHITFDELLDFQRYFNDQPLELVMATGSYNVPGWANALGIFVHQKNPISKITFKQLDGVFGAQRTGGYEGLTWIPARGRSADGNIRTWGQLGLTGEWADKPIHVYGLNLKYHQQLDIERKVFHGGDKWNEDLREYSNYANADGSLAIAAQELMKDLSNDPYGIAYSGPQNITPETKLLSLSEKDNGPFVELNMQTVRNRTYPLFGEEYWYARREPGKPMDPKVKEYLLYVLSRQGQEDVQRDAHFLPLTAKVSSEQIKKLERDDRNISGRVAQH